MSKAEVITPYHPLRERVERHIRDVYGRKYGAVIAEFPHLMLAMLDEENNITCACGIRFATTGFFSPVYLDQPVDQMISEAFDHSFLLNDILEVTTLASVRTGHAVQLVQQVVALARQLGKPIGLFTTTEKLRNILSRAGMKMVQLADADAMRVKNSEVWGKYYDENPAVYAVWDGPDSPIVLKDIEDQFRIFPFQNSILKPKESVHV